MLWLIGLSPPFVNLCPPAAPGKGYPRVGLFLTPNEVGLIIRRYYYKITI
jgi:hypothetical protein